MNGSMIMRRHWRIMTVAILGAVLAFIGSFLIAPTYTSTTRLLIHGREATFLSSTGQDLTAQPGVVDSSLSQSLAATYAGIATSRGVATAVVNDLRLGQQPPPTGLIGLMQRGFAWTYRCTRALVTSGFCAPVDPHEKAILEVQEGTAVAPVGANAGATAGTNSSYVVEVTSSGTTPAEAQQITDAIADELVTTSKKRFEANAAESIRSLEGQLDKAVATVRKRTRQLANYQTANGIMSADGQLGLSASTYESMRSRLVDARAEEADLRAQLGSIAQSLAGIPKSERSTQTIVTGRSTTQMDTSSVSSVYRDLLTRQRTVQASLDGQVARVAALRAAINGSRPLSNNRALAEMSRLSNQLEQAEKDQADLSAALQKSRTTAAQGPVEMTRLDSAGRPTYPDAPKRYIYLGLGLLLGGLMGFGFTAWSRRNEPVPVDEEYDETDSADDDLDDTLVEGIPAQDGVLLKNPHASANGHALVTPEQLPPRTLE